MHGCGHVPIATSSRPPAKRGGASPSRCPERWPRAAAAPACFGTRQRGSDRATSPNRHNRVRLHRAVGAGEVRPGTSMKFMLRPDENTISRSPIEVRSARSTRSPSPDTPERPGHSGPGATNRRYPRPRRVVSDRHPGFALHLGAERPSQLWRPVDTCERRRAVGRGAACPGRRRPHRQAVLGRTDPAAGGRAFRRRRSCGAGLRWAPPRRRATGLPFLSRRRPACAPHSACPPGTTAGGQPAREPTATRGTTVKEVAACSWRSTLLPARPCGC
jgi:hypothetical protein